MDRRIRTVIILVFVGFFTSVQLTFGQCCPYVQDIEIIPESPSVQDSIHVVTWATTPNQGEHLGYEVLDSGSVVHISGCYYSGVLTAPHNFIDTINIGLKAAGTYEIVYTAYQSHNDSTCLPVDTNSTSTVFTVGYVGIEEPTSDQGNTMFFVDLLGRKVEDQPNKILIKVLEGGTRKKVFRLE